MTDYSAIADSEIATNAAIKSETAFKLRDNPEAILEGATGAPRIQMAAGDFIPAVKLDKGDTVQITDLDGRSGFQYLAASYNNASSGVAMTLTVRFSNDGGSSWSSSYTLLTANNGDSDSTSGQILLSTGVIQPLLGYDSESMGVTEVDTIELSLSGTADSSSHGRFIIIGSGT